MTIKHAILYSYSLPLVRELKLKFGSFTERHGLLLELTGDSGATAFGDICPLPGFSDETLEQAEFAARSILSRLVGHFVDDDMNNVAPASVAFAVETALLQLRAAQASTPPPVLMSPRHRQSVPVNGLLTGSEEEILKRAKQLVADGYRTLKLKVGQRTVDEDIHMVKRVRKVAGDGINLRLDANRSMTLDSYEQFARAVVTEHIEYIEEPTEDVRRLFGTRPDLVPLLPVALDETLSLIQPDELAFFAAGTKAIVVKPTVLGFDRTRRFCEVASKFSIPVTVSAAFCSGVGLLPHIWLASAVNDQDIAAGFDSAAWLAEDLIEPTVTIEQGCVKLEDLPVMSESIQRAKLTELARA